MKVEIELHYPETRKVFTDFLVAFNAAEDAALARVYQGAETRAAGYRAEHTEAVSEPAPEEAPKTRKPRAAKAEKPVEQAALEPAQNISATPEDRKPVAEIEEAELVDEATTDATELFDDEPAAPASYTLADVKQAVADKFNLIPQAGANSVEKMAAVRTWLMDIAGVGKMSEVPEDKYAAVVEAARG